MKDIVGKTPPYLKGFPFPLDSAYESTTNLGQISDQMANVASYSAAEAWPSLKAVFQTVRMHCDRAMLERKAVCPSCGSVMLFMASQTSRLGEYMSRCVWISLHTSRGLSKIEIQGPYATLFL